MKVLFAHTSPIVRAITICSGSITSTFKNQMLFLKVIRRSSSLPRGSGGETALLFVVIGLSVLMALIKL